MQTSSKMTYQVYYVFCALVLQSAFTNFYCLFSLWGTRSDCDIPLIQWPAVPNLLKPVIHFVVSLLVRFVRAFYLFYLFFILLRNLLFLVSDMMVTKIHLKENGIFGQAQKNLLLLVLLRVHSEGNPSKEFISLSSIPYYSVIPGVPNKPRINKKDLRKKIIRHWHTFQ